jgi:hypothetical protein
MGKSVKLGPFVNLPILEVVELGNAFAELLKVPLLKYTPEICGGKAKTFSINTWGVHPLGL